MEYLANIDFLSISGYEKYILVQSFTVLISSKLTEKFEFVTSHVRGLVLC